MVREGCGAGTAEGANAALKNVSVQQAVVAHAGSASALPCNQLLYRGRLSCLSAPESSAGYRRGRHEPHDGRPHQRPPFPMYQLGKKGNQHGVTNGGRARARGAHRAGCAPAMPKWRTVP